jgi:hypothetical protein
MNTVGTRLIAWQGGEHQFCLAAVGNILSLEQSCGAPIGEIFERLTNGRWGINDLREPIRLGLIGGGLSADEAMKLVKINVDQNPNGLAPSAILALAIIDAVIVGVPDDPLGKAAAVETGADQTSSTMTDDSAAQPSSESAVPSDGLPSKPIEPLSGK